MNKHDVRNMTSYMSVKSINGKFSNGAEDDLHTISTFKSLADGIVNCSKIILEKFEYQFEDVEITSMWGNVLNRGNAHPPHTHSNNIFYLVCIIYKVAHLFNFLTQDQRHIFLNLETLLTGTTLQWCSLTLSLTLHFSFRLGLCTGFHPLRMNV